MIGIKDIGVLLYKHKKDLHYLIQISMVLGSAKRKTKKVTRCKIKVYTDEKGKFVIINNKIYRMGDETVDKDKLKSLLQKEISTPIKSRRMLLPKAVKAAKVPKARRMRYSKVPWSKPAYTPKELQERLESVKQKKEQIQETPIPKQPKAKKQPRPRTKVVFGDEEPEDERHARVTREEKEFVPSVTSQTYVSDKPIQRAPTVQSEEGADFNPHARQQEILAQQQANEEKSQEQAREISPEKTGKIPELAKKGKLKPPKMDKKKAVGQGKIGSSSKGMSDEEIDKVMDKYPEYLGTISHDEIKSKILPEVKPRSRFCFVINTDPRNKPGQHWQAFYIDGRPEGEHEIDFFDSYADKMDDKLLKDIKLLADKVAANGYLKLKENGIELQNSKSSNCGWFCCQFLIDRLRGKPFPEASKFHDSMRGEASVENFKKQHGGFNRYIASFQEGEALPQFYTYYPPSVRKYMTDEPITSLKVARIPISKTLTKILDTVSVGGWSGALKQFGYDTAFHLFFIINGKYRLERNHTITMFPYAKANDEESITVPVRPGLTIKSFLENTAQKIGPSLQRYDGRSNNCQIYILQNLSANGMSSPSVTKFVDQNIQQVIQKLPWYSRWLGSVAKGVTDTAHLAEHAFKGTGQ
jgi:hypothetical protein